MKSKALAISILLSFLFQGPSNAVEQAEKKADGGKYNKHWNVVKLKQPVSLPGLPHYTGQAKFDTASRYPKAVGGENYIIRYKAREHPTLILDWYKNYFEADKTWTLQMQKPNFVSAKHKSGNYCFVSAVMDCDMKNKGGSRLSLHYHIQEKH